MARPRATQPGADPDTLPAQAQLARDYAAAFGTGHGDAVLVDLRKRFGRRRSFVAGDPYQTAFQEGQRDVYLLIMSFIDRDQRDPEELPSA